MRVLLKYKQDLFLRNGLLYRKAKLKNHDSVINQFVLPKRHRRRATLALHDDYGHLGMETTLGLLQEWFFWPKMMEDVRNHIRMCARCTKYKQQPEREKLKPITCMYPLELVHLDFFTIGKEGTEKSINVMIVTDIHYTKTDGTNCCQNFVGPIFGSLRMAHQDLNGSGQVIRKSIN